MGAYGTFSMYNSLISSIYKIESKLESEAAKAEHEDSWSTEVKQILTSRVDYANNFCANMFGMFCCHCCVKNWQCSRNCALRRARHDASVEKLS
jgi:hypothetical protein